MLTNVVLDPVGKGSDTSIDTRSRWAATFRSKGYNPDLNTTRINDRTSCFLIVEGMNKTVSMRKGTVNTYTC